MLALVAFLAAAGPPCEPPSCARRHKVLSTEQSGGRVELACARDERKNGPYRVCHDGNVVSQGRYINGRVVGVLEAYIGGQRAWWTTRYPHVGGTRCTPEGCTVNPEGVRDGCDVSALGPLTRFDALGELGCAYPDLDAPDLDFVVWRVRRPDTSQVVDYSTSYAIDGDVLRVTHHPGCVVGGMEREPAPPPPAEVVLVAAIPADVGPLRLEVAGQLECKERHYAP